MTSVAAEPTTSHADSAPTQYLTAAGIHFAFRAFGQPSEVPLVLLHRFRATMDDWDPLFLDTLAAERQVVIFDNAGVGRSSGESAATIPGMAEHAAAFIRALGHGRVDLLGWSMGGAVSLAVTLDHPELVRRLVVAASGPGAIPGAVPMSDVVRQTAGKPVNDDEDFLFLFFDGSESRRAAGRASLERLHRRLEPSGPPTPMATVLAMATALGRWRLGDDGRYAALGEIRQPVLVATGAHDVMIPAHDSFLMAERVPDAELVVYSDAGHGFLFQHAERFGGRVNHFLAGDRVAGAEDPRPQRNSRDASRKRPPG